MIDLIKFFFTPGKRPPGEAENSRDQRMARSKRKVSCVIFTIHLCFELLTVDKNSLLLN